MVKLSLLLYVRAHDQNAIDQIDGYVGFAQFLKFYIMRASSSTCMAACIHPRARAPWPCGGTYVRPDGRGRGLSWVCPTRCSATRVGYC